MAAAGESSVKPDGSKRQSPCDQRFGRQRAGESGSGPHPGKDCGEPGPRGVCLTGGSSPRQLYRLLATEAYRSRIPWDRVHWFIGDERFVPADDPLNNMGTARRMFLDSHAPASNIHPIPTDTANPREAARRYESELQSFYGADRLDAVRPLFDVVLMGVGPDGHTASLFPNYPALEETERWVVDVPRRMSSHLSRG
jgi:6-phosphogluconolactonase